MAYKTAELRNCAIILVFKRSASACEAMATTEQELAFFVTQCWGVKFYDLADGSGMKFGSKVHFVRKPYHPKDSNCVEAMVGGKNIGHVAAEAHKWLSPLLLGPSG